MNKQKDSFFLFLSIAFHLVILVTLSVKIFFFPSEKTDYQRSVRVDIVALPEKQVEIAKIEKPSEPKAVKKEKPVGKKKQKPKKKPKKKAKPKKIVFNKKKAKEEQSSAVDRVKALQKLKNMKDKKKLEYKGNAIHKGNSLTGLEKLHHDSYHEQLVEHIRSYWNLPEWLASGNLNAKVVLLINKNGGIKNKSFSEKSGNELFDQQVFGTLEKASPLPIPPPSLVKFYATEGIEIRFPE